MQHANCNAQRGFSPPYIPLLLLIIVGLVYFFGWIALVWVAAAAALMTLGTAIYDTFSAGAVDYNEPDEVNGPNPDAPQQPSRSPLRPSLTGWFHVLFGLLVAVVLLGLASLALSSVGAFWSEGEGSFGSILLQSVILGICAVYFLFGIIVLSHGGELDMGGPTSVLNVVFDALLFGAPLGLVGGLLIFAWQWFAAV